MAGNPGRADRLMLEAAKTIISLDGCSGLRVRDVVARAKVNLGMFHYHFKNKDRFTQILLQEYYDEFFSRLELATKKGEDPIVQLRQALLAIGLFTAEENGFYIGLFKDLLNDNPQVLKFARANVPRHLKVFRQLIRQCQLEGKIVKIPVEQIIAFLMTSIHTPTIIAYALLRRSHAGVRAAVNLKELYSEKGIRTRVDLALKGLCP